MKTKMNIAKITAVIMVLVSILCFCAPINAEAKTYALKQPMQYVYDGDICTVKYYAPEGYENIFVYTTNNSTYYIFYITDTTGQSQQLYYAVQYSETAYYLTASSLTEVYTILFTQEVRDYKESTNSIIQRQNLTLYTGELSKAVAYSKTNSVSMESAYYTYITETTGTPPEFESNDEVGDGSSGGDSGSGGQLGDDDDKGILEKIADFLNILTPNGMTTFIQSLEVKLAEKLEDNKFYTSVRYIEKTLTDLYSQDYTDPEGFKKLGLTQITLGKPKNTYSFNFGNDVIGDWYQTYEYQTGNIDWGLKDLETMPMGWFFGEPVAIAGDGTIGYSKGVKSITDPIISAFLWFAFAFTLWHKLPDIVSGEIATITGMGGDIIDANIEEQRSIEKALEQEEKQTHRKSYEYYKENKERNAEYKARYYKEKRGNK